MLVGSDYDDIRQSLTHENLPSRGSGQALPTSAGNAGIAVSRGPLVPEHVLHRDCHKNKQKVISVNVNTLLQLKIMRVTYFSFKLRTVECRFLSLSRRCWPW